MRYHRIYHPERVLFLLLTSMLLVLSGCMTINRTKETMHIPDGVVIFSFDDGPNAHADTTARLLDVLWKYDVRALFVLLGENVDQHPELVRRICDEGHLIVNHGYCDKWAVFMDAGEFTHNLIRGEDALAAALDGEPKPRLYRPQGGMYQKQQQRIWRERGYALVPGTVRLYDAAERGTGREKIIKKTLNSITRQGGGLILLHDARDSHTRMEKHLGRHPEGEFNRSWIPEMVEEIIRALIKQGYRINGFDIIGILDIETS
jgi:peptidoglycan/xylan/chitin deacetylase (PgdA/CDA1 family)